MKKKGIALVLIYSLLIASLTGCSFEYGNRMAQDIEEGIVGLPYTVDSFDNYGHKTLTVHGTNIRVDPNLVKDRVYSDGGWGTIVTESSVVTVTVDGHEFDSCGDTLIFYQDDLIPDYNFYTEIGLKTIDAMDSAIDDVAISDTPMIDSEGDNLALLGYIANRYKNYFGKQRVVLIKSQMGTPIYAFSGDSIYWEVSQKLPKCTKLSVDGKSLYIHRANFQIIDVSLLSDIDEFGTNTETITYTSND